MTSTGEPEALNLPMLYDAVENAPTVEAGLITVLVETRHVVERISTAYPDISELALLARQLDAECAKISDAVMANTPAQGLR